MNPRPRKELDTSLYESRFAARLKMLREKAGLTAGQVAEALGVTPTTIFSWESAHRSPKISDLPRIAEVLGLKKTKDILPNE